VPISVHSRFLSARLRLSALCLLAAARLSSGLAADQETPPAEFGLRVGARAPSFNLKDQHGKEVSLESLLKKGPVAVVFYRSAGWCMFCKFELIHLQHNLKQFEAAGGQVVGISYDSIPVLKRFADSQSITLPLLSDDGSKTIDAFNVRDHSSSGAPGCAAHAAFVLDRKGVVRAKFLDAIYQEQPGVGILLKAVREARNTQAKG
jgi:peroxiredoxin